MRYYHKFVDCHCITRLIMTDKKILREFRKARKKEQEKAVVRPAFTLFRELLTVITCMLCCAAVIIAAVLLHHKMSAVQLAALFGSAILIFVITQTKNILLLLIFLYQRFAPASVRSVCLFTPSCSEYMRLSILKYGVCRGVVRGLRRLRKCHPPNGGIDEP